MATMVYAKRVPIDIISISCCRSKIVAIIPAKTTPMYFFYSLRYAAVSLQAIMVPTQLRYTIFLTKRMVTKYILSKITDQ
jgi:hypothetical protein